MLDSGLQETLISYDERMIGANHPTKDDTLNRALLYHVDETSPSHTITNILETGSTANANLQMGDGFYMAGKYLMSVTNKTAGEHLLTFSEFVITCDATSGDVSIVLPLSPQVGQNYIIKRTDSSGNGVTVDGNGANIDDLSSQDLSAQYDFIRVVFNGTIWLII